METIILGNKPLTLAEVRLNWQKSVQLELSTDSWAMVAHGREVLESLELEPDSRWYGINTGFGALCDTSIPAADLEQLQENLLMSHACGMGQEVMEEIVKTMLLLKIKGLSLGYSGISTETLQALLNLYHANIWPVVWETGSLGASGDLAPLAHLSLPLIGMGSVRWKGEKMDAAQALQANQLTPIRLRSKEGLALINGTQFMSAWGCFSVEEARRVCVLADLTAALSCEAFQVRQQPFDADIHRLRPFKGQGRSAERIRYFLEGSKLNQLPMANVQDPYSFRCIPQVHGAVQDVVKHVAQVMETEINAVTDNPLVIPERRTILSGGNFHGEPLALALDYLGIAMCELASIAERRTFQLLSGKRGLPPFCIASSGLNSGLMIPQYTAAAIVSMNKQLATPASVDTITSSDGQEDHVSMGANAAVKTYKIVYNIEKVLAIEWLTAMQAFNFREIKNSSPLLIELHEAYRSVIPFLEKDRYLYPDIQQTVDFMRNLSWEGWEHAGKD